MRSAAEVRLVLELAASGWSTPAIARVSGVPPSTIQRWRTGALPTRPGVIDNPALYLAPVAESYAYLLGLYLGDGHIARHRRDVLRLVIYLDASYPRIVDRCAVAMAAVVPDNTVTVARRGNCVRVSAYSKNWAVLLPQHGAGAKHTRKIDLAQWQRQITHNHARRFLEGLVHSDGTRGINRIRGAAHTYEYARYQFSNRSQDIKDLFCEHCDLLGIEWRVMNAKTISVARRASVALMDEFIGPKSEAVN